MGVRNLVLVACAGLAVSGNAALAQDSHAGHNHGPAPVGIAPSQAPADAPKIAFEAMSHDFGVISDDTPVTKVFKFTNAGVKPLLIGAVQGSCGCTVPALEKKEYAAGESGEITVTYNPSNRRGKQHTTVTVNSNDPVTPAVSLQVHSDIKPQMYIEPMSVNFGQSPKGKGATTTIKVLSRTSELRPTQAVCSNPAVSAKLLESKEVMVGEDKLFETPLEISVLPTVPVGQIVATVTLRTTDPNRQINVPVHGEVVGDFAVAPTRLQFLNVQPSSTMNLAARVTSRSGKPFKILGAQEVPMGSNKMFESVHVAEVEGSNPPAWTVTVTGTAPAVQTAFRGDIVVTTDAGDEKTFKIPYNGYVNPQQAMPQARFNNPTGAPVDPWAANPSSLVPGR